MLNEAVGEFMYSVVVVDDDKLSGEIISECIEKSSLDFTVAGCFDNPSIALEYLHKNYVDVLVTDIIMPEMSGIELIEKIKKINPSCRFIIVSGYRDFNYAKYAIQNKVENYLIKPIETEELLISLKNINNKLDIDSEIILNIKKGNFNINDYAFINDSVIKKAVEYIDENYASDITREDVAKITHLSPSYFSTYFKSKTGIKFYDYLLLVRISKAVDMLKDGKSTKDICESVGYSDVRFFNRKFKEFTSYTVAEYRKKIMK